MAAKGFFRAGRHTPNLVAAFVHFDVSFMCHATGTFATGFGVVALVVGTAAMGANRRERMWSGARRLKVAVG